MSDIGHEPGDCVSVDALIARKTQVKPAVRYYLLSNHEATFDKGMCMWWRPKAAGYSIFIENAGLYTADEAIRHIDINTFAIPESVVKALSRTVVYVDDKELLQKTALL